MTYFAARMGVALPDASADGSIGGAPRPVAGFRDASAYVLLGDAGMGKTTALMMEARETNGYFVSARDFVCLPLDPAWKSGVLFIDGLDEVRVARADGRIALDQVRARLAELGNPKFRISCRTSSWYGSNDREHLKRVSPDGALRVILLSPLSGQDIHKILKKNHQISNPHAFLSALDIPGAPALVSNPLNLKLLCDAISDGAIPKTRRELLERACSNLLEEHNEEHEISNHEMPGAGCRLDTASYLSAMLVLTGCRGYSLFSQEHADFLPLRNLSAEDQGTRTYRQVLGSGLFSTPSEGLVLPPHRHICEFLGARYVASRLEEGLLLARVFSLLTGSDGKVMADFYGFVAWLSEHSPTSRLELMDREPTVIATQADIRGFELGEKRRLLVSVVREAAAIPSRLEMVLNSSNLGELATQNMAVEISERLNALNASLNPTEEHHTEIMVLAQALRYGDRIPGAADLLLKIVRCVQWTEEVRRRALVAAVKQLASGARDELVKLAADILEGHVADDTDHLLGLLLMRLYPDTLGPDDVARFLRAPKQTGHGALYGKFWASQVPEYSTEAQLATILDALVVRRNEMQQSGSQHAKSLQEAALVYLAHYLERFAVEDHRHHQLLDWLCISSLALEARTFEFGARQSETRIREFLEFRPEVRLKLEQMHNAQTAAARQLVGNPLMFLGPTTGTAGHCESSTRPKSDYESQERDEFTQALSRIDRTDTHIEIATEMPVPKTLPDAPTEVGREVLNELKRNHGDTISRVHGIPMAMLHRLAAAFLGIGEEALGRTPVDRLRNLLGDADEAIEAVRDAFRRAAFVTDGPSELEIYGLIRQHELHLLALPCIAGLADVERHPGGPLPWRNTAQIRRAVAMYFYTYPLLPRGGMIFESIGNRDAWFIDMCAKQPRLIADVYTRYTPTAWKNGSQVPAWLRTVTCNKDFEEIARLVAIALLKKLPIRSKHTYSLRLLLHAALRLLSSDQLRSVIRTRLVAKSMTVKQRVYWLAAGLFVAPEAYAKAVTKYVHDDQYRTRILVHAMDSFPRNGMIQPSNVALEVMVRLLGPFYPPGPSGESSEFVYRRAQSLVGSALRALAAWPTEEVRHTLATLSNEPSLASWHPEILACASHQRAISRAKTFQIRSIEEVKAVLSNGSPTSPCDLTALTVDVLGTLARNIRTGSTSDWRQYWNVDSYRRVTSPRPEDLCRDALSSDLEAQMRSWGVSVHTESRHANDKRSDILVRSGDFRVSLEVKKSCSRDLWSAMRDQLIEKYCTHPESGGFGIYVVFWFGDSQQCRPTKKEGVPLPESAEELEWLLIDSLPEALRHRIAVVVVDVANPS